MKEEFMELAVQEARKGIKKRHGGPFGCVIVMNGKVIAKAHNRVLKNKDSTCHGEVEAIRKACRKIKSYNLSGAELYTTAEPCPMCLGAILWANIKTVYYGCSIKDTESIGFRDNVFYDAFYKKNDLLTQEEVGRAECLSLFKEYGQDSNRKSY